LNERALRIAAPLSILALWEASVRFGWLDARIFPAPSALGPAFVAFAASGALVANGAITLERILAGFFLGAIPGVALGLAMGINRYVRAYFDPLVGLLYPIPKIALLPLIMFIFGLAEASKYVTVAIGVFFVMAINTEAGVRQIAQVHLDVARAYRLRTRTFYLRVLLPGALPNVMAGARIAIGLAVVLAVAAEFVAARSGLGFTIFNSNQLFDVQTLYVAIVAVSLLGFGLNAVAAAMERVLVPWRRH